MCFGRCDRSFGYQLAILSIICTVANTLLFFPNGQTRFASERPLSADVDCLLGILGGGFLVLITATVFIGLGNEDSCGFFGRGKSCAVLSSVLAAFVGILGSGYCVTVAALALSQGTYFFTQPERNCMYPFTDSSGGYSFEYNKRSECQESQFVQWDVTFLSILLVFGGMEFILCFIQLINGILGGLSGLCRSHEETSVC